MALQWREVSPGTFQARSEVATYTALSPSRDGQVNLQIDSFRGRHQGAKPQSFWFHSRAEAMGFADDDVIDRSEIGRGGHASEAGEHEARGFPNEGAAMQAAKAQGATHFLYDWDGPEVFRRTRREQGGHTIYVWENAQVIESRAGFYLSDWAYEGLSVPAKATLIAGGAREASEAGEHEARDFPSQERALESAFANSGLRPTHFLGESWNFYTFSPSGWEIYRTHIYIHEGKYHVGRRQVVPSIPAGAMTRPPAPPKKEGREAAEQAPVVYEDGTDTHSPTSTKTSTSTDAYTRGNVTVTGGAGRGATTRVTISAEEGRRKKSGPLRWKRKGQAHYQAAGMRGEYVVKRQTPNRRQGILPWAASCPGGVTRTFDTADAAKTFAQSLDTILSDPQLCPAGVVVPARPARPTFPILAEGKRPKGRAAEEAVPPCGRIVRQLKRYGCNYVPGKTVIAKPHGVYTILGKAFLEEAERSTEVFVVILLDIKSRVIDVLEVGRGQKDRVGVGIDDVIAGVLGGRASSFICAHLHPSGDPQESKSDRELTVAIWEAANVFSGDIEMVSHCVLGNGSMTELTVTDDGKIVAKKFTGLRLK